MIGPSAADAGASLKETNASLGILANLGLKGSAAGTALRRSLIQLSSTKIRDKLQDQLNIEIDDEAFRDFPNTLARISQASEGLSKIDRASLFVELFGAKAAGVAKNVGQSNVKIKEFLDTLDKSGGLAKKTSDALDGGLGGAVRKLGSAFEGIAIAIGDSLESSIAAIADRISAVSLTITEFVNNNQKLVQNVVVAVAAITALGAAFVAIGITFAAISIAIKGIVLAFAVLKAAIAGVGLLFSGFAAIVGFVASPLGLIVAALVGAAGYFLFFTEAGAATIDWFRSNFGALVSIVKDTVGGIFDAIVGGDIELAGEIAFTGLRLVVAKSLQGILSLVGLTVEQIGQLVGGLVKKFEQVSSRLNRLRIEAVNALVGNNIFQRLSLLGSGQSIGEINKQLRKNNALAAKLGVGQQEFPIDELLAANQAAADKAVNAADNIDVC